MRLSLLLIVMFVCGCVHAPPQPERDPRAWLTASAAALRILPTDGAVCAAAESTASALDAAAQVFGESGFPALSVDVARCGLDLHPVILPEWTASINAALGFSLLGTTAIHDECARTWTRAAIEYARGALPGVLLEIEAPDGLIDIPAVPVKECVP